MPSYEIRLIIDRVEQNLFARWDDPRGLASKLFPLVLPLGEEVTEDLRWYLEKYSQFPGAGDQAKAARIAAKLEDWGRALFKAIFLNVEENDVYRNLMQAVQAGDAGLITLCTDDPEVLVQPWEMMRDSKSVLALRGVGIRRQLVGTKPLPRFDFHLPLRILLIVSRPENVGFIDPRNSIPPVLDACEALEGLVEVDFCTPPTLPRLSEMILQARQRQRPYHIVHYDGHGTYLPVTGVGALSFEDEQAQEDQVSARRFGDILVQAEVPLVLLEACRGAGISDRPVFGSLAPALLDSGVGSVIAFSHSVHIRAARLLVESFYQKLVERQSVGAAVQAGRAALRANPGRFLHLGPDAESVNLQDWFIPQLYQVGEDPVLIPEKARVPQRKKAASPRQTIMAGFPPEPMYKFHGRALELLELERIFRKEYAVVLSGMGGMGKTALAREAAAWWLRTGLFDKAVFISFEGKVSAFRAAQLIGLALEGEDFSSRSGEEQDPNGQWQTALRLFRKNKVLVVWDNFESTLPIFQQNRLTPPLPDGGDMGESQAGGDLSSYTTAEQAELQMLYRQLTSGKPKGRLLVTCRPLETNLPGVPIYELKGLNRPDSLHLLSAALDKHNIHLEDQVGYERHAMDELLDLLDDHPLSIELIAPRLKTLTPAEICTDFATLLEQFTNPSAPEDRNKTLLASLEFSRQHLSPAAQAMLPWLAWFEGGVFEAFLLDFTRMSREAWAAIRSELVDTALIKLEVHEEIKPTYLRFHPTLAYAARPEQVPDLQATEESFIQLYIGIMQMAYQMLDGQLPRAGMQLMDMEEANFLRALKLAFAHGLRLEASQLADTLNNYLRGAGRLRERYMLSEWVHKQLREDVLDESACVAKRQYAWSLLTQGKAQEAVDMLKELLTRLETEGLADGKDSNYQISVSKAYLGRILDESGRPDLALQPIQEAVAYFEQYSRADYSGNLATTMGDLANTYEHLGRFNLALQAAERSLEIHRNMGNERDVASSLGRIASILADAHRYPEAEKYYDQALQVARTVGDLELQGTTLQHQGFLQREQGRYARAVELFKQAIAIFQESNSIVSEMRTCDLLASAELMDDELDSAEAWYSRALQLAERMHNRAQKAVTTQNLGILYQKRAESTEDPQERLAWLEKAMASIRESLAIKLEQQNQIGAASSYSQLSILYQLSGDYESAQEYMLRALAIHEPLDLPELVKDYFHLSQIAKALGDQQAASAWQDKFEAKRNEIQGKERPEGVETQMSDDLMKLFYRLAQWCYQARQRKTDLVPDAAEIIAQLRDTRAPFNQMADFFQAVADGRDVPPLPEGLPPALASLLQGLKEAVENS